MYTDLRRMLRRRVREGAAVEQLDAEVDRTAGQLDDDERSALWLYCWHLAQDPRRTERDHRTATVLRPMEASD